MPRKGTRFLYDYQGIACLWEVMNVHDDGYLCRIVDGAHAGVQARFESRVIQFGQMRLEQPECSGSKR